MKNIDLTKVSVKIIKISFSYNKATQNELNFRTTVSKIQASFKIMEDARLSLAGKVLVFKSLTTSKFSLSTSVPNNTKEELIKILKNFLWNFAASKIKHSTILMDYRNGG